MKPSEADKPFAREIPLYPEGSAVDDLVGGAETLSETSGETTRTHRSLQAIFLRLI